VLGAIVLGAVVLPPQRVALVCTTRIVPPCSVLGAIVLPLQVLLVCTMPLCATLPLCTIDAVRAGPQSARRRRAASRTEWVCRFLTPRALDVSGGRYGRWRHTDVVLTIVRVFQAARLWTAGVRQRACECDQVPRAPVLTGRVITGTWTRGSRQHNAGGLAEVMIVNAIRAGVMRGCGDRLPHRCSAVATPLLIARFIMWAVR
jgi:hypothetical protein